jgi:hypothetical protein
MFYIKSKIIILLSILLLMLSACGGGGGSSDPVTLSSGDTNTSNIIDVPENPLTSASFTLDESDFNDTTNFELINAKSLTPKVTLTQLHPSTSLDISSGDITFSAGALTDIYQNYNYPTSLSQTAVEEKIGKPLYIDGEFAGIIDRFENGEIIVRDAQDISEVYEQFDIEASVDELETSITRSIRRSIGKYDYLNKEPLKVSFISKDVQIKSRALKQEPVVVIEFPEGYTIPLSREFTGDIDCELSDAMCDAAFNYDTSYAKEFDKEKSFGSVVFSTAGSRIEIGLGAYIRAMYDYNTIGSNQYYFEFKPTAYYLVNMVMSIKGTDAVTAGSETFKIVQNGLNIAVPLHKFVSLNINVIPEIVIGMEAAPNNKELTFEASLESKRTGYIRMVYSNGGGSVTKGIEESSDPLVKSAITLKVDTDKEKVVGYLFPEIAVRPQLKFTKISKKVNIAYVRNGARIDTMVKGIVNDNWIVENDELSGSTVEDVYLKTYLYGLIDYKWDVKVGDTDIVSSDNWSEIYKSSTLNILEWMSQYLQQPKVTVTALNNKRLVAFDIESAYKNNIRFYYTTNGDEINKDTINNSRDGTTYQIWRIGDAPIELSEDTIMKVKAVLFTDEIPEKASTLWAWGMSISQQAELDVVYIPEPLITPSAQDFTTSVNVAITQSSNDEIKVSHNAGLTFTSCGVSSCSLTVSETEDLYVKAVRNFNGKEYSSIVSRGYYRKCASQETVGEEGKCVTQCPYLWDIAYVESGVTHSDAGLSPEELIVTNGISKFLDFFIAPTCDESFTMTTSEQQYCQPYLDAKTYESTSTYENSGGESGATNNNEYPALISHHGGFWNENGTLCDSSTMFVQGQGEVTYSGYFEKDISTDIITGNAFTVAGIGESGNLYFTPRTYKPSTTEDTDIPTDTNTSDDNTTIPPDNNSDTDTENGGDVDGSYEESVNLRWHFQLDFNGPLGSGTMTINNLIFDCAKPDTMFNDPLYGYQCGAAYGDESNVTYSYTGITQGTDVTPLIIYTKGIQFAAVQYYDGIPYDIGDMVYTGNTYETHGAWNCVGDWADTSSKLILGQNVIFSTTSVDDGATCTYTFLPCQNETCTSY